MAAAVASKSSLPVWESKRPRISGPRFRLCLLFGSGYFLANMPLAKDLLHPSPEETRRRHKKKRLVQSPNSYFMDVKCPGCYKITTVFSHAQTVVLCVGCSTVLCQPTGGKARLTEGCSFRRKQH
ncbi:40S ribosomal protein S27 [Corythoichthys intestinalis]|uniref:40S ribosomal protein S27 n=1 Tax=Corythoichthys intestinalis TaxID=161448 RepID=UPI0025A5472A|nr:40S ribosomal protein S27 [Corythoichthys intestinalis]XP_061808752.1 small ribosomal subunit protein eS27-like [Nerophis lumbriciformis]